MKEEELIAGHRALALVPVRRMTEVERELIDAEDEFREARAAAHAAGIRYYNAKGRLEKARRAARRRKGKK